jgi:glycosidase
LRIIDDNNPNVLSFVRSAGGATVLVSLNFSDAPKTLSFDAAKIGVPGRSLTPLAQSVESGSAAQSLDKLVLPPFASFVGEVH